MTRQRRAIYEVLQASEGHLTAEEIFLRARALLPTLSVGTVYRNLGLMVRDGEVRRLTAGERVRYDRNTAPHDHLVCVRCGRLSDAELPGLQALLEQRIGRPLLNYQLTMEYVCPACAARAGEGR